jgi:cell division protein FtsB
MNQNNDEINNEEGKPTQSSASSEVSDTPQTVETSLTSEQPKIKETPLEKKEPTRFQKFLRKALIWLVVVLITFAAGFLVNHFWRYQPLSEELKQSQTEKANLEQDAADLQSQIDQLQPKLEAANAKIADLEDELAMANARSKFYQVLVDVNNAQLELFLEDIESAQTALADTQESLDDLTPIIMDVDPDSALSLPRRLALIVDGLARDPETARIDLELFTKDLLALEPLLFNQ